MDDEGADAALGGGARGKVAHGGGAQVEERKRDGLRRFRFHGDSDGSLPNAFGDASGQGLAGI